MNIRWINVTSKMSLIVIAAAFFMLMPTTSIQAQTGPPPRVDNPDPFRDMRERRNREAALRGAEIVPRKTKDDPRRAQVMIEQLREDFKSLQVIRNEMVRALKAEKPLNYKDIADKTAEVHKRASRLKASLALNNIDADKDPVIQVAPGEEGMKDTLINLCNGIITFIESPVFKSPGVSNIKEATEARRVLQNIIDLSSGIKKSAESLSKTNK